MDCDNDGLFLTSDFRLCDLPREERERERGRKKGKRRRGGKREEPSKSKECSSISTLLQGPVPSRLATSNSVFFFSLSNIQLALTHLCHSASVTDGHINCSVINSCHSFCLFWPFFSQTWSSLALRTHK